MIGVVGEGRRGAIETLSGLGEVVVHGRPLVKHLVATVIGSWRVVPRLHHVWRVFVQGTIVTSASHHPVVLLVLPTDPWGVLPPTGVRTLEITPWVPPPETIFVLERQVSRPLLETRIHGVAIGCVRKTGREVVWLHVGSPCVGRGHAVCPVLPSLGDGLL